MTSKICLTISGARPSDGSSSSSRRGRLISARAIASICCSPPESVPPRCGARSLRRGNSVKIRSRSSSKWAKLSIEAPICRFSNTVMRGKMRRPSGDWAIDSRAIWCVGRPVMSLPSKVIRPRRARGAPKIVIIVVDLPAPLAPISVTISPFVDVDVDALERLDLAVEGLDAAQLQGAAGAPAGDRAHCSSSFSIASHFLFVGDAEIGGDDLRIVAHLRRRAVGDLDAVVEHDDMVGNLHHDRHVVLDQQDRGVVVVADRAQERVEIGRFARIEAGGRLVEAEQHRIGAHGAGDLEPALGAVGQLAGRIVGAVDQADLVEPVFRALDRLGLAGAVARRADQAEHRHAARAHQRIVVRDQQVFEHRHALEQADVLERARDLRACAEISWSGMRSSRNSSPFAGRRVACRWRASAPRRRRGVATPSRASASRPSVGL